MANYYHIARAEAKKIRGLDTDVIRRRQERKAEVTTVQTETVEHALRVEGRACRLGRSDAQYRAAEAQEGFLPWNGDAGNLIDRFDGRALLDMYVEYDAARRRPRTADEEDLEELVAFEAYRDLVALLELRVSEEAGIRLAEDEGYNVRAALLAHAAAEEKKGTAAGRAAAAQPLPPPLNPAGTGQYGAVSFSYGNDVTHLASFGAPPPAAPEGSPRGGGGRESSDDDDGSGGSGADDSESEGSEGDPLGGGGSAAADGLAAGLGIPGFSALLRRALREEADEAEGRAKRPQRPHSRKKAAQRARRMAGQGLQAPGWPAKPSADPIKPPRAAAAALLPRRSSPTYERYRSRSRSRSPSEPRRGGSDRPRTQFITSFSSKAGDAAAPRGDRHSGRAAADAARRSDAFHDARPRGHDPNVAAGPVSLPREATAMHGVRPAGYLEREENRRAERERERERAAAQRQQLSTPAAAAAAAAPGKDAGAERKKETPMERLKRLRAAQLAKTHQADQASATQKRLAGERERAAREAAERGLVAGERLRDDAEFFRRDRYDPGSSSRRSPARRRSGRSRSRSPEDRYRRR